MNIFEIVKQATEPRPNKEQSEPGVSDEPKQYESLINPDYFNPTKHPEAAGAGLVSALLGYLALKKLMSTDTPHIYRKHAASIIPDLKKAKEYSDISNWSGKQSIIVNLMLKKPEDWIIDSDEGGHVVGVSHKSGFRFHLPRKVVPPNIKRIPYE